MTAKRKYQHDTFQDTSWGPHGLLNFNIPSLELAPLPTVAVDSPPYSLPNDSLQHSNRTGLANAGLAVLGGLLLLGATMMGSQLWQQNIHQQQQHVFTSTQPFVVNAAPMALAAIAGTPATPNPIVLPDTAQMLQEAQAAVRTPYGRDDPFSPLVSPELPNNNATNEAETAPKPPVLSFVGIIEGASGSGRLVAILKSTGETPTTYIKEPGDRFEVDGHRVMLKRVNKRDVAVVIDGLVENLSLQEYSDNAPAAANTTPGNTATNSDGSRSSRAQALPAEGRSR